MKKIAIIYYTGTGNTEAMAEAVLDGAIEAGADASMISVSDITADEALKYDALILGCPAMGVETLEEAEMEPFFSELEGSLENRIIGLFGSYGWGDGEWMRSWEDRVISAGGKLVSNEGVICNEAPDDDAIAACKALGEAVANA